MEIDNTKVYFTNKSLKFLISIFIILVSIFPLVIVSINNLSFQYVPIRWAFVEALMYLDLDHMKPFETNGFEFDFVNLYPGYYMFLLLIAKITNIPVQILEFLPITGFATTLIYYILLRNILKSEPIAIALTIATIPFDLAYSINLNSLNSYSLTIILFLSFVYFYFCFVKLRDTRYTLLLILLFIGSFFMHHRVPVWMILLLLAGNVTLFFNTYIHKNKNKKYIFHSALAFIVIYFTFNKVIYKQYLPKVSEMSGILGFYTLEDTLRRLVHSSSTHVEKYILPNSPIVFHSVEYNLISTTKLVLILIPIFIFLFTNFTNLKAFRKINNKNVDLSPNISLFYSLLVVFFIEILAYFILGRISLVYYVLVFPILAGLSIKNFSLPNITKRKITAIFIITLLLLSVAKFTLAKQENFGIPTLTYEDVKYSSNWLINNTVDIPVLITDLYTFGKYLVEGSSKGVFFKWDYYTQDLYKNIVENGNLPMNRYLVVNEKDCEYPIVSLFWKYFEPLLVYRQEVNSNEHLNKIYDDNMIEIYHTL